MWLFPQLRASDFRITSRRTPLYNCIAWAAGSNDDWWEYRRGYTWPNAPREASGGCGAAFPGPRFCEKPRRGRVPASSEVAIYGDADGYTHAARQLPNGRWSSKIGRLQDIEHVTLANLTGTAYGVVAQVLRKAATRRRSSAEMK